MLAIKENRMCSIVSNMQSHDAHCIFIGIAMRPSFGNKNYAQQCCCSYDDTCPNSICANFKLLYTQQHTKYPPEFSFFSRLRREKCEVRTRFSTKDFVICSDKKLCLLHSLIISTDE